MSQSIRLCALAFAMLLHIRFVSAQTYLMSTLMGGAPMPPTPIQGTAATVAMPSGVAVDRAGTIYLSSLTLHAVFKLDVNGILTRAAGVGHPGYSGDGGAALAAELNAPLGLAVDTDGNVYIADTNNHCVRRLDQAGLITTVAGNGTSGFSGDRGRAINARLHSPEAVVVDPAGNLYIADTLNMRIRKVSPDGFIDTVATHLGGPKGLAMDTAGSLYISETAYHQIQRLDPNGLMSIVAGPAESGLGDNGPARKARLEWSTAITMDGQGNLYLADVITNRVRKIDSTGIISTVAGDGYAGYGGDEGLAFAAHLNQPTGVAVDSGGNLIIADSRNQRIRRVDANGTITTIVGGPIGDGGPVLFASIGSVGGVATDTAGNLYFSDTANHRVRKVSADGTVVTIAGTGLAGYSGDNGPALEARIAKPESLAVDRTGSIYIADAANHCVRRISPDGIIRKVAGTGEVGYDFSGDGRPAVEFKLGEVAGVAVDSAGNLFIADESNNVIRKVTPDGLISTAARNRDYVLAGPQSLAVDSHDHLYVADANGIRRISRDGSIATLGNGERLLGGLGLAVDTAGSVFFAGAFEYRVRRLSPNGVADVIAGTGKFGYTGDGRPALEARIGNPAGLAVAPNGDIYVGDPDNNAIRMMTFAGLQPLTRIAIRLEGGMRAGAAGGAYTVTVGNAAGAGRTRGTVTVTEWLPANVMIASMSGEGWRCSGNVCERDDPIPGGDSYPPISVVTNVTADVRSQVTNRVVVSGGGTASAVAVHLAEVQAERAEFQNSSGGK